MIITGWPDDINNVPNALRPYHGQHDSLRWTYTSRRINHSCPRREEKGLGTDLPRTLRNIKGPEQCVFSPGINMGHWNISLKHALPKKRH